MTKTYIVPGKRIPFVKAGTHYGKYESLALAMPVMQAMGKIAQPDFVVWGQVIPDPIISNIAREAWLKAGLSPDVPGFSTTLACATSMVGCIQASGMLGRGGTHLAMVGGSESMSHVAIALKSAVSQKLMELFMADPAQATNMFQKLTAQDFNLPVRGWANTISGRSMGEHTEDTAKFFNISRQEQDRWAYESHKRVIEAQKSGFFDDLIVPFSDVEKDLIPRADSTFEKLSTLKPVFDTSEKGTLTAGNSSPLTDGAAAVWVADEKGLERLDSRYAVEIVDWELAAMNYKEEGILMAPSRAIPRLLDRHDLKFSDIALYEIHEAFATQVLANIKAIADPEYRKNNARVDRDLGDFPWDRVNPNGGSLAIGHPFAATGARDLSQAAKELSGFASGNYAIVSVCADGGQGVVMLLRKP